MRKSQSLAEGVHFHAWHWRDDIYVEFVCFCHHFQYVGIPIFLELIIVVFHECVFKIYYVPIACEIILKNLPSSNQYAFFFFHHIFEKPILLRVCHWILMNKGFDFHFRMLLHERFHRKIISENQYCSFFFKFWEIQDIKRIFHRWIMHESVLRNSGISNFRNFEIQHILKCRFLKSSQYCFRQEEIEDFVYGEHIFGW